MIDEPLVYADRVTDHHAADLLRATFAGMPAAERAIVLERFQRASRAAHKHPRLRTSLRVWYRGTDPRSDMRTLRQLSPTLRRALDETSRWLAR